MNYIFIEALRAQAWVGIHARERVAPQVIELDLSFGLPGKAMSRDDIGDSIDYAKVIERVRAQLAVRHFNLIETLGEFLVGLLCGEFAAPWAKVRVVKLGVMKDVRRVGVCIERESPLHETARKGMGNDGDGKRRSAVRRV
jgi:dihydroneopterin aldolase